MKTIFKVAMMLVFVAFANTILAMGNLKVNILPLSDEKAQVAISSLTNTNFSITVIDSDGHIVYYKEELARNEDYNKVFDFSNLEDGTYKLTVVSNDLTTERTFVKDRRNIKVGKEQTTKEPFFAYQDGLLKCTYLNFNKENLTLYFYDGETLIFTKKIGSNFTVNEGLNLSKLRAGEYLAVLAAGGKEYCYEIVK